MAAALLVLGLLPMASESLLGLRVSVYRLPGAAVLRFLLSPMILAAIWALDRFVKGFARYTKILLTASAALQVVSLFLLGAQAKTHLAGLAEGVQAGASAFVPVKAGAGFFLLLAVSVAGLVWWGAEVFAPKEE